ncbi:MAG: ATP-binding protein [Armatimonadetes bacterium]|nr:ATP-binding protein [Armatimonadota bacterium]
MANERMLAEARRMLQASRHLASQALPDLPSAPNSVEQTGLKEAFLVDLAVKTLFVRGTLTGREICDAMALPYQGVVENVLRVIKDEMWAAIRGGQGVNELDWEFYITEKGGNYARDLISRMGYAGPAPVPFDAYVEVAGKQLPEWQRLNKDHMRSAFDGLVVSDPMLMKLGPAFNSGKSMFLYGHAGNGKTLLSERMSSSLRGGMLIPHAIEAGGQVVQLFDPAHHELLGDPADRTKLNVDRRWIVVNRPFIIVGGELQMSDLEMVWDTQSRHYIAPLQLKANGGVFMIDDFGRQRMPARDLLNRWIVPLEKNYDYHSLSGGVQIQVPFNLLIIFSTNLAPRDLVEEAFLRRIKYKVEIGDPDEAQFREIWVNYCKSARVPYEPAMLDYVVRRHYGEGKRGFRSTHPRDLINQAMDIARFNELPMKLTETLIDAAVDTYFVDLT